MEQATVTHTPGPFQVVEGNSTTLYIDDAFGIDGGRDYYLAEVRHGDPDELEANAKLFAASPDLLYACMLVDQADGTAEDRRDYERKMAQALRAVRAALQKAGR